jgi:hypothetical protein
MDDRGRCDQAGESVTVEAWRRQIKAPNACGRDCVTGEAKWRSELTRFGDYSLGEGCASASLAAPRKGEFDVRAGQSVFAQ